MYMHVTDCYVYCLSVAHSAMVAWHSVWYPVHRGGPAHAAAARNSEQATASDNRRDRHVE